MGTSEERISRRTFLNRTASAVAGATAGTTALSYSRILGANDRISLGLIGVGRRGQEELWIISQLKEKKNVEMTAVCDLWTVYRDKASQEVEKVFGKAPRAFQAMERVLELKDIDAVVISTPEHQHAVQLRLAVEAGKHVYIEKAMANVLEEAKAARDAVLSRNLIVQVGTQHRSEPYQIATRELYKTGVLGKVSKVELVWNLYGPRWRGRAEVKQTRQEDVDWPRFLYPRPLRPFDPQIYWEYRLYRDLSSGIPDGLMCHGIDLIQWILDDYFPKSAVAQGGVFAWHDGRENPDTFHTVLEYPKGFLVSYSCSFGNDYPSFARIMGNEGTLVQVGVEGSPKWKLVERRLREERFPGLEEPVIPDLEEQRAGKYVLLPGDKEPPRDTWIDDRQLDHMTNWLDALRSGKQPAAPVQAGFAHSVACIMSDLAYRSGKKVHWDPVTETILDHPPAT